MTGHHSTGPNPRRPRPVGPYAPLGLSRFRRATGRQCRCGALADPGAPWCRKCRARSRWTRRRGGRHHDQ